MRAAVVAALAAAAAAAFAAAAADAATLICTSRCDGGAGNAPGRGNLSGVSRAGKDGALARALARARRSATRRENSVTSRTWSELASYFWRSASVSIRERPGTWRGRDE
eukprot:scaffold127841_cov28-Tisochrysis_lutea.AAC.9